MKSGNLSELKYDGAGLIPAVVQDFNTGAVLMVAWMNRESLEMTLQSGYTHFWSRSRQQFWKKGETSGHLQKVREVRADCDGDTLLVQVEQAGPACHTNSYSCFFHCLQNRGEGGPEGAAILDAVYRVILDRRHHKPEGSYVASLLEGGTGKVSEKILEEAGEVAGAARDGGGDGLVHEVADLWFHTLVLLGAEEIPPARVFEELARRYGGERELPPATGLKERFEKEVRIALKAGRKDAVAVFRLTLSEIQSAEKEKRSPLEEGEIVQIIRGAVKKRKEAVILFRKGGRNDLVEKETAEARLLEDYLPAPLSAAELLALVEEGLAETGASSPRDLGIVMKWIIPRVEGRADGSEVSRLVREKLSSPA